jgi:hypothetical protein
MHEINLTSGTWNHFLPLESLSHFQGLRIKHHHDINLGLEFSGKILFYFLAYPPILIPSHKFVILVSIPWSVIPPYSFFLELYSSDVFFINM